MTTTLIGSMLAGMGAGFAIAIPIGPMGLLCIQRTLASGMRVGVSTGLGAVTVNAVYGTAVLVGLATTGTWIANGGRALGFLGGVFLLWSACRTLARRRTPAADAVVPILSPRAAYMSAIVFNAANPLSIILILALLTPLAADSPATLRHGAALVLGMVLAATTWWVCLTGGIALVRARLGERMIGIVNQVAAVALSIYGAIAIVRSLGP